MYFIQEMIWKDTQSFDNLEQAINEFKDIRHTEEVIDVDKLYPD